MFAFSHKYRLTTPADFRNLANSNNKIEDIYFVVYIVYNQLKYNRIGFTIPKTSVLMAVNRNRVKRICREFFRINNHRLQGKCNIDILLVAKKHIAELSNHEFITKLEDTWEKLVLFLQT